MVTRGGEGRKGQSQEVSTRSFHVIVSCNKLYNDGLLVLVAVIGMLLQFVGLCEMGRWWL